MLHHQIELFAALIAFLILAAVIRVALGNPRGARNRVRVLRWRIRLYLRPGPGYANLLELAFRWSRLRAVRTGGRARPSLPWWTRLLLPVTFYAVRLGRAHYGRRVIASMEDQTLIVAAPRTGKSGSLADRIIDHPGAVVTTTTRTDLFDNTSALRGQHGTLHVFNPEGIGGLLSTFRWNPLQGCEQPAIALQRAVSFTAATESKGLHDMAFWIGKASSVLASFLHAAALDGRTMHDVYEWAHGTNDAVPEQILTEHPAAASGWLGPIQEVRRPGRTSDSIRMTVTRALAWLADPAVEAATSPGPGEGFDVAEFAAGRNTLYMIGTGREEAPIAPLFRAFAEYVHEGAAFVGSLTPHGRLDPPLLMAMDEVTQICPVPLPQWMADSAGKGILVVAVCHGLAQLEARWDSSGARAIWDTAGIKLILGGVTDADTLDRISRLCGDVSLRTHTRTRDHRGHRTQTDIYHYVRVLPPELLRTLPEWRALVIRGNLSPVVVRLRMAWRRRDYRHARRASATPPQHQPTALPASSSGQPPRAALTTGSPPGSPHGHEGRHRNQPGHGPEEEEGVSVQPSPRPSGETPDWWRRGSRSSPLSPGNASVPRPRRPWEPPTQPGNRR